MTTLERLRELEKAATPGPWRWSEGHDWKDGTTEGALVTDGGRGLYDEPKGVVMEPVGYEAEAIRARLADVDVLVAARNALPDLLAVVEAARDILSRDGVPDRPVTTPPGMALTKSEAIFALRAALERLDR